MKDLDFISGPVVFLMSLLSTGAAVVGWSYDKFQPKEAAQEFSASVERRLDRIENKLDRLIERVR